MLQGQDGLAEGLWESEFRAENKGGMREDPYLRIQGELYTHFEVVSSPK